MERLRISPQKRLHIAASQEYKCAKCRELFGDGVFEIDHKVPLWRGGKDAFDNMRALCRKCHGEKTRLESILREDIRKEQRTGKSRYWDPAALEYVGNTMSFEEFMNGYKHKSSRDHRSMHRRLAAGGSVTSRRYLACLGELELKDGSFRPGSAECQRFVEAYNKLHPEDQLIEPTCVPRADDQQRQTSAVAHRQ